MLTAEPGVFAKAKRSIHHMSITVDVELTGFFGDGGGEILLPSYGHRSAVRPL